MVDEQSIFQQALDKPAGQPRTAWLDEVCGIGSPLRERIDAQLRRHEQANSFPENPPAGHLETLVPNASGDNLAAWLNAGLATALPTGSAVVMGNADHSVLKVMGQNIDVPRVVLREAANEGHDPIVWPKSPEMPARNSDSRYQLQGEIARGGMGAILKGRDTDLGRELAIKVLLDQHKDIPEVIQRFVEEAQIGGQLQHPGIAPIYELGQFSDKRPFFSMKLVKGQTLSKLLAERENPAADRGRFIGIFKQVCQTMAYAHSRGVIHRDLKPANIMVGAFGEVQVMDWGLAKVLPAGGVADEKKANDKQRGQSIIKTLRTKVDSDLPGKFGSFGSYTQMGSVMGTPAYMPPEQALGEIDNLDERADVFGLGAILCEILSGKPPYVADNGTQVYRMASRGKLADCIERLDMCGADADLIALTKHCLELEPVDRPRDAGVLTERVTLYLESVEARLREAEVQRAAEAARADAEAAQVVAERQRAEAQTAKAQAESARAEAESARASAENKRRRTSLALAASVVLLVGVGSGGWLYLLRRESDRQTAEASAQRQHAAEMQALAEQRDDQRKLAEREKSKAETATRQAQAEKFRSLEMLADMQTERGFQEARDGRSGVAALWFANAAKLTPHDPDRQLANHRRAESWGRQAMMPVAMLPLPEGSCTRFAFRKDGVLALTVSSGRLRVWDWRREAVLPWCDGLGEVADAAWSPDGMQLAVCTSEGEIKLLDPASGEVRRRLAKSEPANVLAWSPDGTRLVAAGNQVIVWNIAAEPRVESEWPHPGKVYGVNFNRAGTRLATACDDDLVRVFAINEAARPAPLFAPVEHVPAYRRRHTTPDFCDSDRKLVTILKAGYPTLRDAETGTITEPGWANLIANRSLEVSPNGRWIAVAGRKDCRLLSVAAHSLDLNHGHHVETAAFHPDGQTVLTACLDGKARQWPLLELDRPTPASAKPVESPQLAGYARASYSPDGTCFAIETGYQVTIWEQPQSSRVARTIAWGDEFAVARVSQDGRLAVQGVWHATSTPTTAKADRLTVARVSDGLPAGPELAPAGLPFDASVCSDNRSVAVASVKGTEGLLTVFDIAAGTPVFPPIKLPAQPASVSVRPGRPQVAVLSQNGVLQVFDTQSGARQWERKVDFGTSWRRTCRAAYSPDGATLVTVTHNSQLLVWDAESGELKFPMLNPVIQDGPCRAIAFSPDGRLLATAVNGQNMVQVWDLITGAKVGAEMPHPGDWYGLFSVEFSPDGKRLVTGHKDGWVRIFDWRTGQLVGAPMQNPDEVYGASFTADGRHVLAAVRHSPLHIWDVSTRKLAVPPADQIPSSGGIQSVSIIGDCAIVTAGSKYFVLDLSALLPAPSVDLPTLTRQLELATYQKTQFGELVSLNLAEWSARWVEQVASRTVLSQRDP